jgi:TM2 domain-containing membrane protein YozV
MSSLYEQNETLKEIYNKTILPQSATNVQNGRYTLQRTATFSKINRYLFYLFYISCIIFGVVYFSLTKNAKIKAMNIYMKVIVFIIILLYPIYASVILQIIVFIVKYIYAFAAGIPYASTPRTMKKPTVQTMYSQI